jgi:hypothetical protein
VNKIIYEGLASRKSYILVTVAILLLSTISVKFGIISTFGQQPTVNDTAEQVNPSLETQDKGMPLATPEPSANVLGTAGDDQSDTNKDDSNEKATDTQEQQDSADEATKSSTTDDNVDSNKMSGTSQSDEPKGDDVQNRGDDDQNRGDDVQNRGDDDQNRGDDDQNRGDDDQNRGDDDQDSNGNEDENDEENDGDDTPLEYRLPFP